MQKLIFRQLFEPQTSTYTYLIADSESKEALLIDPVLETVQRDWSLIQDLELQLKYILETHIHADHITGSYELKKLSGAKSAVGANSGVNCADVYLNDGEQLNVGSLKITAISTPGHTNGCTTYSIQNMIFTGDSLMIRSAGRTDFQQGSPEILFSSIREKLFTLPDDTIVYPGHDYKGIQHSSIKEEKLLNPRIGLNKTKEEFINIMNNLNLAHPKKIDVAVPANLNCGKID